MNSDLQFYKKPEKDEAIVATHSSSLTSQRLETDGSLLPVKVDIKMFISTM
jgi:hypothetical protein